MTAKNKYAVKTKQWEAALSEFLSKEGGKYLFPEVGKTKVRILLHPERDPLSFYQSIITVYHEKSRTRYMIPVLVADQMGVYHNDVKLAVVAKTVLKGIYTILAAGEYDLLHPENGHSIIIVREGEGLKTKYSVMPTKDPVPVDYENLEFEGTLTDAGLEFEAISNGDKDDTDEDVPW